MDPASPTGDPTPPQGRLRRLLARLGPVGERDFGCLWLGRTLSTMGVYTFRIGFITYIIALTGSPSILAAATAAMLVPALVFYLFGGVTGDRVSSRRAVLVAADLLRFVAVTGITVATLFTDSVGLVVLLALLIGVGDGFFQPVSFAFMTEILRKDQLVAGNSANSISRQIAVIVGPLLGGLLVGLGGPEVAFGFTGGTFLASAGLIMLIRRRVRAAIAVGSPASREGVRKLLGEIGGGLRYVVTRRWLLLSFTVGALGNAVFTGGLDVAIPFVLVPEGTERAEGLGGYYALQGVGALLGAVLLARIAVRRGVVLFRMITLMAACLGLVGLFGQHPAAYVMAIGYGIGLHVFNSVFPAMLQQRVPDELMSRIGSVVFFGFHGLAPLGVLVMGPVVQALGPRTGLLLSGACVVAMCLVVARASAVRELRVQVEPGEAGGDGGTRATGSKREAEE